MKFFSPSHKFCSDKKKRSIRRMVFFTFLSFVATISSIGTAYAGIFSFLTPIVEGGPASAKANQSVVNQNSQNMNLLQAATNIDPNPYKPGNLIPIAGNTLVPDIALSNSSETEDSSTEISTYIVRAGDTVSSVAKMFKVSVNTVLWANDLTSKSVLKEGQILVILPVSGIMYTVKKGDTLSGIAKKYGADAEDIKAYNDLSVSSLAVGQPIIIPNAEIPREVIAPTKKSVSLNEPLLDNVSKLPSIVGFFGRPIIGGKISQELHGHNGVDFAAPVGSSVIASAPGTVIVSRINGGWNGGYGNFVVISHKNGTQTLYAHLQSKTVVKAGDVVSRGDTIGYIGMTGLTTGPHVHFEVRGAKNPF